MSTKKDENIFNSNSLREVSEKTDLKKRLWLKGKKQNLDVYRIPIKYLYFNIQNGRYADKMIQLRADNKNVDIDPREEKWKKEILSMLRGTYKGSIQGTGTEKDQIDFERLHDDLKERGQIEPGVVLGDGGVIDGNRRLAALKVLYQETTKNSEKYAYFEGVILPDDVSAEDRWRIEAGIQLGRSQQLDYSPMNKLLKIYEGYNLFKDSAGKNAEDLIAETLYGVDKKEIEQSIKRISLIDEYLEFFGLKGQYHLVSGKSELFIEAQKNIEAATQKSEYSFEDRKKIKLAQFIIIRGELMDNWDMREISQAISGSKKKKTKPVKKAVDYLIKNTPNLDKFKEAIKEGKENNFIKEYHNIVHDFKEIKQNEENSDKPLQLAQEAKFKLQTLENTLNTHKNISKEPNKIINELEESRKSAIRSIDILKK